ncbi:HigA family addiction module antidote protein [bacterium]|nr:HigA family addiction module antidote protein [bacterium]
MKKPPHPGRLVRDEILAPLELDVTNAAKVLGVARSTLSKLLNERASLSAEMALRIEKAFGPKADHLMRMQLAHDMANARLLDDKINVSRYEKIAMNQ